MGAYRQIEKDTIFFDGVCNLCNGAINFVIDRDTSGRYQFASLQSEVASEHLPERYTALDSIVLYKVSGKIYDKSSAALEIAKGLGGGWSLFYVFKIIPKFIRDAIYNWIARNRYKWFGKRATCRMPSPELKERFLEAS